MSIGNTWNRLRIWGRFTWDDNAGNITASPGFFFGLHSNPQPDMSNGPLTASCSHFVGYKNMAATWTRAVGPVRYITTFQDGLAKKIGNVVTNVVGSWAATTHNKPGVNTTRQSVAVEFTKGTPNFTVAIWAPDDAALPDPSYADLISISERRDIANSRAIWQSTVGAAFSQVNGSAAIAVDENANGPLNSVCVAWDRAVNCYVSEVQWAIMA
jgi:hypothetical protein